MSASPGPHRLSALALAEREIAPESTGWQFQCVAAAERRAVEGFIAASFLRAYGAHLTRFFPLLLALRHGETLVAACGLRRAAHEPLFLETYLDRPVDDAIGAATAERVARTAIVEVGNLAVTRAGLARSLIVELTHYLKKMGLAWCVFSAVPSLRNNFIRLGIPMIPLAPADAGRLPVDERARWGTYYESAPAVIAVRVAAAHAALARATCTR